MDMFGDSEEEDNNPFTGTNHLYASGIGAVADGEDDFVSKGTLEQEQHDDNEDTNIAQRLAASHNNQEEESECVGSLDTSVSYATPQFEPYVSLSMSMANYAGSEPPLGKDTDIQIIEAGDYKDPWGKHAIGYVIHHQGKEVVRRYSEFDTLRQALIRLLPTIIIPPIPSKHPLIKYILTPLTVESDSKIIEKRKRMLSSFLNNCNAVKEIRSHIVFAKFLDPEYVWKNVLSSPPIVILPVSNLLAPPLNPTKPSPLHLLLPAPTSLSRLDQTAHNGSSVELETKFAHLEGHLRKLKQNIQPLHKMLRQHRLHFHTISSLFAELGAYYNAFSLEDNVIASESSIARIKMLSNGIEKIGHGFDVNYVSSEILVDNLLSILEEPLVEIMQFLEDSQRLIHFRKLKQLQYQIIECTILKRETRIKNLKETQNQLKRLEEALQKNAQESPTIAEAMKHIENNTHPTVSDDNSRSDHREEEAQEDRALLRSGAFAKQKKRNKTRKTGRSTELEPHLLTEHERQEEIERLHKEVEKLNDCFRLINKDMNDVNESTLNSLTTLVEYIDKKWDIMLKKFSKSIINWISECLKAWKNAKTIVDNIDVE